MATGPSNLGSDISWVRSFALLFPLSSQVRALRHALVSSAPDRNDPFVDSQEFHLYYLLFHSHVPQSKPRLLPYSLTTKTLSIHLLQRIA